MTRPVIDLTSVTAGLYTTELREAGVAGPLSLKCEVLASGVIQNCREVVPLPPLGAALIERLHATRATPARYKGKAINVDYLIRLTFE